MRGGCPAVIPPPLGSLVLVPFFQTAALVQGSLEARGGWVPLGRVLGQAAQHDPFQIRRDVGADPRQRHHRVATCAIITEIPSFPSNGGRPVKR